MNKSEQKQIADAGYKDLDELIKTAVATKRNNKDLEARCENLEASLKGKGALMNDMVARHKKKIDQIESTNDSRSDRMRELNTMLNKSESKVGELQDQVAAFLTVIKVYNERV